MLWHTLKWQLYNLLIRKWQNGQGFAREEDGAQLWHAFGSFLPSCTCTPPVQRGHRVPWKQVIFALFAVPWLQYFDGNPERLWLQFKDAACVLGHKTDFPCSGFLSACETLTVVLQDAEATRREETILVNIPINTRFDVRLKVSLLR